MTFLDPVTGLTALAAGWSLTLLWYFLKLRRRPLRVSSTLLWSQAARDLEVNAPLRWIRASWLLLLQLLAVGLLAAAAGRPAVSGAGAPPERWVLLIDRSASMQAFDTGAVASRFEDALLQAETIIRRMGPGEEAMVVSFALGATLEAPMTGDEGVLLTALGAIEPTDQPAMFGEALGLVAAQLGGETSGVRLVVLSDGGFDDPESAAPIGDAEVRYIRCGGEAVNAGLVAVSAQRDTQDPVVLRAFVRAVHSGPDGGDITVTARLGETLVGVETITARADQDASAIFETRNVEGGVLSFEIAGADALAADNHARLVVPRAWGAGALVVHPAESSADPFLLRALEVATKRPVRTISAAAWNDGAAAGGAVVVFDRVDPARAAAGPSIHISAGSAAAGVRRRAGDSQTRGRVLAWDRAHDVTRYVSLGAVAVPAGAALVPEEGRDVDVLASGDAGPLVIALDDAGHRRVISSFGPADSNWATDPSFALFIALALEWVAPQQTGAASAATTAEPVTVRAAAGVGLVEAEGPLTRRAPVRADGMARLGALPGSGLYELRGAEGVSRVAVNLASEADSRLRAREELVVAGRGVGAGGVNDATVRELWRWCVLAALVLASAEWLVYARKMYV